jgi:hypothetical protein
MPLAPSVKECTCVAGTCALCVVLAPLLVLAGFVVYVLMLLGMIAGTAWGFASAVKGPLAPPPTGKQLGAA